MKFTLFFLLLSEFLFARSHCIPERKISIGCTDTCQPLNEAALHHSAQLLGYSIELIPMRSQADKHLDGILIEGGPDIHFSYFRHLVPEYMTDPSYEALVNPGMDPDDIQLNWEKDEFEHQLLQKYFRDDTYQDTALLGICRGMQMLTVVNNIPLYVDIPTQLGIPAFQGTMEQISIEAEASLLRSLFPGRSHLLAYERHHQALHLDYFLRHPHPNMKVTATMKEGKLVEAIEFKDRPAIGVQFHPEHSANDVREPIFGWFLEKACEKSTANRLF